MENLCKHIEKLLAYHDYVVVPHLGGFVVQIQSAQISQTKITPPAACISFNPLMHHADGLLAIEIARSEQISYRQAMKYIQVEVEKLKSKLQSTGSVKFGDFGIFYQDEIGLLVFSPNEKLDFLPFNFQLSTLNIAPRALKQIGKRQKISSTLKTSSFFRYAAVGLIAVGLFAIAPSVTDSRLANKASIASFSIQSKPSNSLIGTKQFTTQQSDTTKNSIAKAAKNECATNKIEAIYSFHVVVASSATKAAAENYCSELASSNFPNATVLPPSKTYRVAVKSFNNREEAVKYMENLRKTDSRFETAWVLCD